MCRSSGGQLNNNFLLQHICSDIIQTFEAIGSLPCMPQISSSKIHTSAMSWKNFRVITALFDSYLHAPDHNQLQPISDARVCGHTLSFPFIPWSWSWLWPDILGMDPYILYKPWDCIPKCNICKATLNGICGMNTFAFVFSIVCTLMFQ